MNIDTHRVLEKLDSIQGGIHNLDTKILDLDKKVELTAANTETKLAYLPSTYVSKTDYKEDKRAVTVTRRWTVGTAIAVAALALNSFVNIF